MKLVVDNRYYLLYCLHIGDTLTTGKIMTNDNITMRLKATKYVESLNDIIILDLQGKSTRKAKSQAETNYKMLAMYAELIGWTQEDIKNLTNEITVKNKDIYVSKINSSLS